MTHVLQPARAQRLALLMRIESDAAALQALQRGLGQGIDAERIAYLEKCVMGLLGDAIAVRQQQVEALRATLNQPN